MNIHRWRFLENSNPALYAKIQRNHTLMRRLLEANDDVEQRSAMIKEKEQLYLQLKQLLGRLPGPKVPVLRFASISLPPSLPSHYPPTPWPSLAVSHRYQNR